MVKRKTAGRRSSLFAGATPEWGKVGLSGTEGTDN